MAKALNKAVLFGNATHNKARHQWPIAVFGKSDEARQYVTFLRLAYRAGDAEAIAALDKSALKTDTGEYVKDVKYSITTVPYAPTPDLESEDSASVPES